MTAPRTEPVEVTVDSDFAINIEIVEDGETVDISDASSKQIIVKMPSGTTLTLTASFLTDGEDGWLTAAVTAAQNTTRGTARCRAKVVISGLTYNSFRGSIDIKANE